MSALDLKQRGEGDGYILVDLDRTLARYNSWLDNGENIGPPIPAMQVRVIRWLQLGKDVRIFTARASRYDVVERRKIRDWCKTHLGAELPIQNWKDFNCVAIWDDLAIGVEANTGWRRTHDVGDDPLDMDQELELVAKAEKD